MSFALDNATIEAARAGELGLERLIAVIWPDAYKIAFAIVSDAALAEDAAQEACAAIARGLPGLKQDAAFAAWAYKIVASRAIEIAQRAAVVLHYYAGLSSAEIARATGMPGSTVRFHLMLARRTLRAALTTGATARTPVPMAAIYGTVAAWDRSARHIDERPRFGRRDVVATGAAAAMALAVLPAVAPGATASIEARIAAILQWTPPPPAPHALDAAMHARTVDLETARSLVSFDLVPPSGVPADATAPSIVTTPTEIYSKRTHAWRAGATALTFAFDRSGGRTFSLLVRRFDPHAAAPPASMFEDRGTAPSGDPILVRRPQFAWRNGDQLTTVIAGDGIDAPAIAAIRRAMGGVPVRETTTRRERDAEGTVVKFILSAPHAP